LLGGKVSGYFPVQGQVYCVRAIISADIEAEIVNQIS